MSDSQPRPRPGYAAQIWQFILGLLLFGILGPAMLFAGSAAAVSSAGTVALATFTILITGGAAFWAMRTGRIALGSGLLVGYAVAAVASGGQCTFLGQSANYGAYAGAAIYVYGFMLALVIGTIASIVTAVAGGRRGPQ
jgi:hypothetical protein